MMKPSTFGFLVVRGVRNLGKHWAMTIACIASLSVCMTLNTFATLAEVNVDSMVNYLGQQNEMVVYVDPEADDATIQSVGERITATPGVSRVQYMSKEDVLNQYRGYMADYLQGQLPCLSGRPEPDAGHEPELPEHSGRVQRYRPH